MNKKLLLTAAISAALAGASMSAQAVTVFDPTPPLGVGDAPPVGQNIPEYGLELPQNYAFGGLVVNSWQITETGAVAPFVAPIAATSGTPLEVASELGISATIGSSVYIRYDLQNMQWDPTDLPTAADVSMPGIIGITVGLSAIGNTLGSAFVVFEITNTTGAAIDFNEFVEFDPDSIIAMSQGNNEVTAGTFESFSAATAANAIAPNSQTGDLLTWDTSLSLACERQTVPRINVLEQSEWFPDPSATPPVVANSDVPVTEITAGVGATLALDSSPLDWADLFSNTGVATVRVLGPVSGLENINFFPSGGALTAGTALTLPPGPGAFFTPWVVGTTGSPLTVSLDNSTTNGDLVPGEYNVEIYDGGTLVTSLFDAGQSCGLTRFSGSTDRLDFATAQQDGGGVFGTSFRIVNPSEQGGDVTITVVNDEGDRATIDLGDLRSAAGIGTGNPSGDDSFLVARGSTRIFTIDELLDVPELGGLTTTGSGTFSLNKIRVIVSGQFGDDLTIDGQNVVTREREGIIIQGFTLSQDRSTFIPMGI